MNTYKRRILSGAALMVGIVGLGYWKYAAEARGMRLRGGKNSPAAAAAGKSVEAGLFEIRKERMPDTIDGLVGTIKGNTIELTFNGQEERLQAAAVQVGQHVKKGDILFELDHVRVQARKSQAESIAQRARELQSVGGATQHDVEEAEAALHLAQKDYDDTFVYAPQDGIVCQVNRQPGETVNRNEVIGVLVSSHDKFYVETGVIEGQLEQVDAGQRVEVEIEAFGHQLISGRVRGVSREVTTTGRTGTVLVSLPDDLQAKLRPGMSARCRIYVFDQKTLAVPRTAYDQDKKGLYVLGEDHKAHFTLVKIGHVTRDYYEVTEGIKEGDRIIGDLAASPVEDNNDITPVGEPAHYKDPEAK